MKKTEVTIQSIDYDPEWRHVVTVQIGGFVAPTAVCRSRKRAEVVATGLRMLAALDPEKLCDDLMFDRDREQQ